MSEELMETIEAFKKIIIDAWERLKVALSKVSRLFQEIMKQESITRVRYDPIRKIVPVKSRLMDKRTNMYYCRNNC